MIKEESLLYTKLPVYKKHVESAKQWVAKALSIDTKWSLSFSGGKDSTILLDLVPDNINIIWFDDGWDYPETIDFIKQTEDRLKRKIYRISLPVSATYWKEYGYPGDDPSYSHDCDMSYKEYQKVYGGSFIGLRQEESRQRRIVLRQKGVLYQIKNGEWHCNPLSKWTYRDVWGYIFSNNLPYNPVYDKLHSLGVEPKFSRVGPLTAYMVYKYGALSFIKAGWPDLFNRFSEHFPSARNYV